MPDESAPDERPFLTPASPGGQDNPAAAPAALYDLAVNRAWAAAQGAGASALPAWHARTRFARRVSLEGIRAALARHPGQGEWHWSGGPDGGWREGKAAFP